MSINQQLSAVGTHTYRHKSIHTNSFLGFYEWYTLNLLSLPLSLKCVLNWAGKWGWVTWSPLFSPRGFFYRTHTRLPLFDSTDISTSHCFLGPSATCRHIPASCRQLSQASQHLRRPQTRDCFYCSHADTYLNMFREFYLSRLQWHDIFWMGQQIHPKQLTLHYKYTF